jgi:photosystem II stability/assembly factor-like uncharacterized protein
MKLLAGTSKGLFAIDGAHDVTAVLPERSVRDLKASGGRLLAGADTGLFASEDGGRTWQPSGVDGRTVWQICTGPNAGEVYMGTQPAGVFRSKDDGRTWEEIASFAQAPGAERWCVPVTPRQSGRARALVVDRDPQRLWVGVEVGGVVSTKDAGATWRLDLPGNNPDIHMMVAHPAKPSVLFASTGYGRIDGVAEQIEGNAGMFRSDDGGETWTYAWRGVTPRYARPLCIDPRSPYGVTVASAPTAFSSFKDEGGAHAMLYRSLDGGETWRSLCDDVHSPSAANFHGLVPDPTAPGGVLVGTDTGEVWRVSDSAQWTRLASGLPSVLSILSFAEVIH